MIVIKTLNLDRIRLFLRLNELLGDTQVYKCFYDIVFSVVAPWTLLKEESLLQNTQPEQPGYITEGDLIQDTTLQPGSIGIRRKVANISLDIEWRQTTPLNPGTIIGRPTLLILTGMRIDFRREDHLTTPRLRKILADFLVACNSLDPIHAFDRLTTKYIIRMFHDITSSHAKLSYDIVRIINQTPEILQTPDCSATYNNIIVPLLSPLTEVFEPPPSWAILYARLSNTTSARRKRELEPSDRS